MSPEKAETTITETPAQTLKSLLSLCFTTPCSPSTTFPQPTRLENEQTQFRHIGQGSFGVIHALHPPYASKRALTKYFSLADERELHQTIQTAFAAHSHLFTVPFHIPQLAPAIATSDSIWWRANGNLFPADRLERDFTVPADLLIMERIPPLSQETRELLINKYCIASRREECKQDPGNADCLLRFYLGRRLEVRRVNAFRINLRNYILDLTQIDELGLDTTILATAMADALAILHWAAKTDAQDSEIVMGGPSTMVGSRGRSAGVELWLLDFNQCHRITMDEEGVATAAKAFFMNDPYFPCPPFPGQLPRDGEMWEGFKRRYLEKSEKIVDVENRRLPELMVKNLEAGGLKEAEKRREAVGRLEMGAYTDEEKAL